MQPSIFRAARQWWSGVASQHGHTAAARQFLAALWEFARDSTPERRRQRYGDADYDWDHRVNTTSGAVGWRERLLGEFHSAYQPTEPTVFHEMLEGLEQQTAIDFRDFVFVDLGSGKGRTLLMASDFPFRRIIGIELLPSLHRIALENINKYHGESQKCYALQSICDDAPNFRFPADPTVLYLFHPFPEPGLRRLIANLTQSLRRNPRQVYVLYHNPVLEKVVLESPSLRKIAEDDQYAAYASQPG